jgi:DNA polymerase-3 subunit delta
MQIYANQLEGQLKRGLAPLYLIHGDEPLLLGECAAAVRRAAHDAGFAERQVFTVESGFDWNAFYTATRSLSLFSARRLVELRLPAGRPGESGAKVLCEFAAEPPADILLLVITDRLDRQALGAKWVRALESAGVAVAVYPLEAAQLPAWIGRRMQAHGLKPGPGVVELLAHHMEGNLLAAAQEIEKLALRFGGGELGVDDIEDALCDNARFSVYALADACLKGEGAAATRILGSLRAEGTEPALVLWALVRELRGLGHMSVPLAAGTPLPQVLDTHKVWAKRKPVVSAALRRGTPARWRELLSQAARVERIVKGRSSGEPWRALESLALAVAGLTPVSSFELRVQG